MKVKLPLLFSLSAVILLILAFWSAPAYLQSQEVFEPESSVTDELTAPANAPGDVDLTFTGGVSTASYATRAFIIQPDGKHLIAGDFSAVNGRGRNLIVRLNPDGSVDNSFDVGAGFDNTVYSLALQPDGKIIVGGSFGNFRNLNGSIPRRSIARLNSDGTLDTTFNPNGGPNGRVETVVLRADGQIFIGGAFSTYQGISRGSIALLTSDGSLDATFNPSTGINSGAFNRIEAVALQADGRVLIGGEFTSFNGISRNRIARLNLDGEVDTTFNVGVGANSTVNAITLQASGKILIGGAFSLYNNATAVYVARLNADGSLDNTFVEGGVCTTSPCQNRKVTTVKQISVLSDGRIYISSQGQSPVGGGNLFGCIYRFDANGVFDGSFNPPPSVNGTLFLEESYHAVQADGKVVTSVPRVIPGNAPIATYISRYNANGSQDSTYTPVLQNAPPVFDTALQVDGKVLVAGQFQVANTAQRGGLARFNPDGTLDASFNATPYREVFKILPLPDGKVVVGGGFAASNGVGANIARLNSDGTLDPNFTAQGAGSIVYSIAPQTDGKLLIGGIFPTYNNVSRNGIARINSNGSLDTTFDPGTGFNDFCPPFSNCQGILGVQSIVIQPDGKIIAGGNFTTYNGISRGRIARINPDGTLDTTFNPGTGANARVNAVKVMPDGKILIAGNFTTYNGIARTGIARLNADGTLDTIFSNTALPNSGIYEIYVQADGKIILAGTFTLVGGQTRRGVARLNFDGTLDDTFGNNSVGAIPPPSTGFGPTDAALAVDEAGGKLYFGGYFSTYNNIGRSSLVRLITGTGATATYSISGQITNNGAALGNVAVALSGSSTANTTTDSSGNYSFSNLGNGNNYTVTPTLSNFTFTPQSRTYTALSANQTGANFAAQSNCTYTFSPASPQTVGAAGGTLNVALTTQTGCAWTAVSNANWITVTGGSSGTGSGTINLSIAANSGNARTSNLTVAGQAYVINQVAPCTNGVAVNLPTLNAARNSVITVPVTVSDTTGRNITSYDFDLRFDPTIVRPEASAPVDNTGTLSSGLTITPNAATPGRLVVSAFGNNPLAGAGTLLNLRFEVIGNAQQAADLTWQNFLFNEGTPCSNPAGGRITVSSGAVNGSINYHFVASGQQPKPVAGVNLAGAGTPNVNAVTAANGSYRLTGFGTGAYTVTPAKTGDVNGISSQDAARVSQFVAGLVTLTPNQQIAADATNNGSVSSQDAARISQYVAGIPVTGATGQWKFVPATRSYAAVTSEINNENYEAVLVGEVTGNWTAPAPLLETKEATDEMAKTKISFEDLFAKQSVAEILLENGESAATATGINVSLPTQTVEPGATIVVPITVGNLTGQNVTSFDLDLRFNQAVLQLAPGNPVSNAGTLSSSLTITPNPNTPGRLVVSAFGNNALSGQGTLLNVNFTVIGQPGATTALTWQTFMFNEGDPAAKPSPGQITVAGGTPPAITVNNVTANEGNSGTTAFNFAVTLSAAAAQNVTVNYATANGTAAAPSDYQSASGTLTFAPGETSKTVTVQVIGDTTVESNETFTLNLSNPTGATISTATGTGTITNDDQPPSPVTVSLPANAAGDAGATVTIPITVGNLTGRNVTSYDFDLRFNPAVLQLAAGNPVSNAGTLSSGLTITPNPNTPGRLVVSAFGNNALTGQGTLLNVNFQVVGQPTAVSTLSWQTFQFNEGDPAVTTVNGQFTVNNVPSRPQFDFDGDGKTDLSVFRPSAADWYVLRSSNNGFFGLAFGAANDQLMPADYDGDGKTDIAVKRPSVSGANLNIFIFLSNSNTVQQILFGLGSDVPTPGDWDGDGKDDVAVYRNGAAAGAQSFFFYRPSSQPGVSFVSVPWGASGDKPVAGDYDGDGKIDAAVFRPSNGTWFVRYSSNNQFYTVPFGFGTDKAVPADYDGDGKTDVAVYRDGTWYRLNSSNNQFVGIPFGVATDLPTAADYDGDAKADIAVFRPSNGTWYRLNSTNNQFIGAAFGSPEDRPLPNVYVR